MKPGSFQVFLTGFKDANIFLRDNPWPDQTNNGFRPEDGRKKKKRPWTENCRPSGVNSEDEDEERAGLRPDSVDEPLQSRFYWTDALKQSFREELEKLVILDYIMRNTDRGLDNWMIKVDWRTQEVSIASEPPKMNGEAKVHPHPIPKSNDGNLLADPYRRQDGMSTTSRSGTPNSVQDGGKVPTISLGAIDNSLSWPWKHPDAVCYPSHAFRIGQR